MEKPRYDPVEPEMLARLLRWRDEHEGEQPGGVATKILFEDQRVKIWEMRLAPGEGSALHHHEHDYYLVILQGDRIAAIPPRESGIEPYIADLPPSGSTIFIERGGTEWAVNVGQKTFYEILIELKDPVG